jgi:putative ABC transport system permease protein
MKTTDIITRAGRSLRQAKIRTLLTSLAIAVGAFTVSLALAAGAGGRAYVNQMVNTSGDAKSVMVYAPLEQSDETELVLPEYGVIPEDTPDADVLTKKDIADLSAIDGVAEVIPQIGFSTEYVVAPNGKKLIAPVVVKSDKTELVYAAGALDDFSVKKGQVVIPESYLKQFGLKDAAAAINQKLTLHVVRDTLTGGQEAIDKTLTIVAVDRASDATIYYAPQIYVSPEDGEELYSFENAYSPNRDTYYGATVQVKSGYDINEVKSAIENQNYSAYSLQDSREDLLQMVNIVQWGLAGFGALAIFASIFGIINTQYISVLERTQQIGLMKALGARQKDIGRLFRYEAAWVGFLGGVIGVGLAFIVSLFNPLIATFVNLEEGMKLLIIEPATSTVLVGSLMLVAVAAGYFPSRKAARLDPIEALRTE